MVATARNAGKKVINACNFRKVYNGCVWSGALAVFCMSPAGTFLASPLMRGPQAS